MKTNRCLVVDDNPDLLKITSLMLARVADVEICCCDSAAAALATFAAAPNDFAFVITDMDMPNMNGQELCHRLHELAPDLKIVLSTGSSLVSEADAEANGFFRMLHKPFPLDHLRAAVNALQNFAVAA
jgi:CheY-like chemotaxis protein